MSTVRYYHSAETVTDLSSQEAFAAGIDTWLEEITQPGGSVNKTVKVVASTGPGEFFVTGINMLINGDRNEVTIEEFVVDAASSTAIAGILAGIVGAAVGVTISPIILAVGTAVAGEVIYNTFFDDDVHNIIEEVNGTEDQDLRLYDSQGNWVGGGFYVDGFGSLTEAQAIADLTAEMVASGHMPAGGIGYTVRVHNTASAGSNTVTIYDLENGTSHSYATHDTGGGTVGNTDQAISITTGLADDLIEGGNGNDTLKDGGGQNLIYGFGGDDRIETSFSNNGTSLINGGEGNDSIYADGQDTVFGDAGDDTIRIQTNSVANGGAGNDSLTSISNSSTTNNIFHGGDGNDFIATGGGNSVAYGDNGNDQFSSSGALDTLHGGAGDDYFTLGSTYAGGGGRLINGGSGTDTVKLSGLHVIPWNPSQFFGGNITVTGNGGIIVKKNSAPFGGDTLEGVEYLEFNNTTVAVADIVKPVISGTINNDVLIGTAAPNSVSGGTGNDSLSGLGASDTLDGGVGADTLNGGDDHDVASYGSATSGVTVDLQNTSNNTGDAAGDVFLSIEAIEGSDFDDTLLGDANGNSLSGGAGNDSISGNDGNDSLYGGSGADTLTSGAGNDLLTGGSGADTFAFSDGTDNDTISDFDILNDVLDLSQTHTDFIVVADVVAATSAANQNGIDGILLDLGAGDSVFIAELTVNDLNSMSITY